jgi:hypothetical protein
MKTPLNHCFSICAVFGGFVSLRSPEIPEYLGDCLIYSFIGISTVKTRSDRHYSEVHLEIQECAPGNLATVRINSAPSSWSGPDGFFSVASAAVAKGGQPNPETPGHCRGGGQVERKAIILQSTPPFSICAVGQPFGITSEESETYLNHADGSYKFPIVSE